MKIFKGQGTSDLGKPWRYEEDGLTVIRGCAWSPPGCHPTGCGIKTYVNDAGELVKVEGDENHPITNGRLCVRCLTIPDYVYNPDRMRYPMKRAREDRGKDKWERISWDEAFDLIAEKVAYYKETYGAESILLMGGTGREGGPMLPAYAHSALGTPNACYTQSGYSCYIPRVAGTTYVLGATYPEMDYAGGLPGRYDDPAFTLPELIVFWGKEPLPSNGDGLFGHAAIDMMRRGAKLMSIDPRVNWVATRADWHLRLRPGTDAALGMAMLNVIISEDLYDHDFVDKLVLRLRPAGRARAGHAGGEGRRDLRHRCRPHPRGGARVRHVEARADRLGPGHRPEVQRRAGRPLRVGARGYHRQHRRAGRAAHRRCERRAGARLRLEQPGPGAAGQDHGHQGVPGLRGARAERPMRHGARCAGDRRAVRVQDGRLRGHELPRRHLRRAAQALARRHGEEPGVVLRHRRVDDAHHPGVLRAVPSAFDHGRARHRGVHALRRVAHHGRCREQVDHGGRGQGRLRDHVRDRQALHARELRALRRLLRLPRVLPPEQQADVRGAARGSGAPESGDAVLPQVRVGQAAPRRQAGLQHADGPRGAVLDDVPPSSARTRCPITRSPS